jgi:hypothetical protein
MGTILFILGIVFALFAALAKFLEAWFKKQEKEELKARLEELWIKIDDSKPIAIVQAPLRLLEFLCNTILGNKIFSKKSYVRSAIISTIALISFLGITGVFVNAPFGIEKPPWEWPATKRLLIPPGSR